ncbi:MAG: FGGY-family carbohydrate kinase [Albidovulum sp.]
MEKDLVIGIDSSTSATKATAWDRTGRLIAEGREAIPMSKPMPGRFEQDPADWWTSTVSALTALCARIDSNRVAAVSISNQRETFGLFHADGRAVRPGIVWLDERAIVQAEELARTFGADRLRAISGKPVDAIVPVNRMIWLREYEPENFAAATKYSDVHGYLTHCLTGNWITSVASADPSGMLDIKTRTWSGDILKAAGIPKQMMPDLARPGQPMGLVSKAAALATGLIAGTPVVAGGGDGQCAATGAGAVEPSLAYMNLGTAIVAGVYSPKYGHDLAFRTETAVADGGYIFETVLKTGTFLIDWFAREVAGVPDRDRGAFLHQIEQEAAASPIGAGGIAILPFWQGSMTPHWDATARGVIAGLSGSSKRGDLYRALLEGLALDQAYALEKAMGAMDAKITGITAIGGGTASTLLLQILADTTNLPVSKADVAEASALGAAMCAAKGAGWYPNLREAARAMGQQDLSVTQPIPANVARYAEFRQIYDDLWPTLSEWNRRLWTFANDPEPAQR